MAIRIEHQPSGAAVGMAAYATGRGRARQRRQKYAMDLWRDERQLRARREEMYAGMKYRTMLEGWRQQQAQQRFEATQAGLRERAEAREQGLQQRFEAGQEERRRLVEAERKEREAERKEREAETDLKWGREEAEDRIPEIREDLIGTPKGKALEQLNQDEWDLRTKRDLVGAPETPGKIADIQAERRRLMADAPPPPTQREQMEKDTVLDERGDRWQKIDGKWTVVQKAAEAPETETYAERVIAAGKERKAFREHYASALRLDPDETLWSDAQKKKVAEATERHVPFPVEDKLYDADTDTLVTSESIPLQRPQQEEPDRQPAEPPPLFEKGMDLAKEIGEAAGGIATAIGRGLGQAGAKVVEDLTELTPEQLRQHDMARRRAKAKERWSAEQQRRREAVTARAQAKARARKPVRPLAFTAIDFPRVQTEADYERLASGTIFIGPDEKRRRKP